MPNSSYLVGGFNPSEKHEFVNWDDKIPNMYIYMEVNKIHVPKPPPTSYPLVNFHVDPENHQFIVETCGN